MILVVVPPLHLRKLGNLGSMGTEEPDPRRNKEDSHACRYQNDVLLTTLLLASNY